jgi:hypothetical protein
VQVGLNLGLTKIATTKARVQARGVQPDYVMALCQTSGVQRKGSSSLRVGGKGYVASKCRG